MSDILKLENDSTVNMNTLEAKIAKEVAVQFMAKRRGVILKNQSIRKEVEILLRIADKIEAQQGVTLASYCSKLNLTDDNAFIKFSTLCDEICGKSINWGRIASIHLFASILADHLRKNNKEHLADKVATWLGSCIAKRATWIREEGNGWNGLGDTLNSTSDIIDNVFQSLFTVTLGLGTIAAALFIQAK